MRVLPFTISRTRLLPPPQDWPRALRELVSHERRVWCHAGRAHIQILEVEPLRYDAFESQLTKGLRDLDGVEWVDVDARIGRVIVSFDDAVVDVSALEANVAAAEDEARAETVPKEDPREKERPDTEDRSIAAIVATSIAAARGRTPTLPDRIAPPPHPTDLAPEGRLLVEIAADTVALGASVTARLLRIPRLPVEVDFAAGVAVLANNMHLRGMLEDRFGRATTDVGLALLGAAAQGLAQSVLGPLVDLGNRALLVSELEARREAWAVLEPVVHETGPADGRPAHELPPSERPRGLPGGPVERYADTAWLASLGAAAAVFPITRSLERTAATLTAGTPKAANLGREAFATQLTRILADRGIFVTRPESIRLFDRVDCLVFHADTLLSDAYQIQRVLPVSGQDGTSARHHAGTLLLDRDPSGVLEDADGWLLAPLDDPPVAEAIATCDDPRLAHRIEDAAEGGSWVRGLVHEEQLVAIVSVSRALHPAAEHLVLAAGEAGHRVVVAADGDTPLGRLRSRRVPPTGPDLVAAIRRLQKEDRVVCLVAPAASAGHGTADVSLAHFSAGDRPRWNADLWCGADLTDIRFVIDAMSTARDVSRQCATIALAGSSVGAFMAFGRLAPGTPPRAMAAVDLATVVAQANGVRAGAALARRPDPVVTDPTPWHSLTSEEALERLRSSFEGLAVAEAAARRADPGRPLPAPLRLGRAVAEELFNPLTPVLAVGAGLSMAVGSVGDAAMVTAVVALNALISGVQRFRADQALTALDRTSDEAVLVQRGANRVAVDADRLAPGDVLHLQAGDRVPSDCRILTARGLEADESSLTGESLPVQKSPEPSFAVDVADRTSMLYEGTSIAAGRTSAVVAAVGSQTESRLGLLSVGAGGPADRGVEARLQSLTSTTTPIAVLGGAALVASSLARGQPLSGAVGAGVSLAVAAVPEGLPILATGAQLAAARRLAEKGALVRDARSIEALGRVEVICADKTGTLTEGHLAVAQVHDGTRVAALPDLPDRHRRVLATALRASHRARGDQRMAHPTDQAIVEAARDLGVTTYLGATGWSKEAELPFEPARGFHAALGSLGGAGVAVGDGDAVLSLKGAPEEVLPRCTHWLPDGATSETPAPLSEGEAATFSAESHVLASQGLRILAVAERRGEGGTLLSGSRLRDRDVRDLTLLGFVAERDPVRAAAREAIEGVREAGVRVLMITGDHAATAEGIAAELGLDGDHPILTGPDLNGMDDDELDAVLDQITVCARVTPAHKVRLVRAFQRSGIAVAMTGDGANDAPAIRLADVGIALGKRATSAARDAADLVVLDNRIETIVDAIAEGRSMWASVRDAVSILVGGNLGETLFTVGTGLVTGRAPINARQLLLTNLFTDVLPALTIALRPRGIAEDLETLLHEGPEASLGYRLDDAIAARAIATAGGATLAYLVARPTMGPGQGRTVAFTTLVGTQLGQTLLLRWRDPAVVAAALGSAAALAAIVQTPGLSQMFGCQPLTPAGWVVTGVTSVASTAAAPFLEGPARGLQGILGQDRPPRPQVSGASASAASSSLAGRSGGDG